MGVLNMNKKILVEDYLLTIVAYFILMVSIVTVNLVNQPMLKLVSYILLPASLIITIYGVMQVNKDKEILRSLA